LHRTVYAQKPLVVLAPARNHHGWSSMTAVERSYDLKMVLRSAPPKILIRSRISFSRDRLSAAEKIDSE
jgi:hypothetical protein